MQCFVPFMVDAEAGQASDSVSLYQLLQADCTFSCILGQDILCQTTHITPQASVKVIGLFIAKHFEEEPCENLPLQRFYSYQNEH